MRVNVVHGVLILMAALILHPVAPASPSLMDDDAGTGRDAGDSAEHAMAIEPGRHAGRVLAHHDATDIYSFDVQEGQAVWVELSGRVTSPQRWMESENNSAHFLGRVLTGYASQGGTWHLRVWTDLATPAATQYEFRIELIDLPVQNDGGSGRDASTDRPVAVERQPFAGTVTIFDRSDAYTFSATAGEVIGIQRTFDESSGGPSPTLRGPGDQHPQFLGYPDNIETWRIRESGQHTLNLSGTGGDYTISFH